MTVRSTVIISLGKQRILSFSCISDITDYLNNPSSPTMKLALPSSLLALIFPISQVFGTPVAIGASDPIMTAAGSALLTGENFNSITSRGTWFIEFFSPYCGHCRAFAPTWDKVSEHVSKQMKEGKGKQAGINMAQVNCITYGDLCAEQKIRGYPTLNL